MIKEYIREGKIVPMEVTIKLLENAMRDAQKERQADRVRDSALALNVVTHTVLDRRRSSPHIAAA